MQEFVVQIEAPRPERRPVRMLERTPAGHRLLADGDMDLPDSECARLAKLLPDVQVAGRQVVTEGERLLARLRSALGDALLGVLDGQPARIYLELLHPPLHAVPWEIMVWPAETGGGKIMMAVTRVHHLSRLLRPDWDLKPVAPDGPLRMLIVVGAPGDPDVKAEAEDQSIRRLVQPAQRIIDIDTIAPGNKEELYKRIRKWRPHILHFIGHGQVTPLKQLKFKGDGQGWTEADIFSEIGTITVDDWKPRLVFLNACRSGAAEGGGASLASAFLRNANAVIAMQGDISGVEAGQLAGQFYCNLAAGTPLTEALSAARSTIAGAQKDKQTAFPALTSRCVPTCALPTFPCLEDGYAQRATKCEVMPRLRAFVNQVGPRRKLCDNVWPFLKGEKPLNFMLIRGQPGFGKSLLGAWLLDSALRLGHRVRYVKFDIEAEGVDCIAVLNLIWNAETLRFSSPLTDPLPELPPALVASLRTSMDPLPLYAQILDELRKVSTERPVTIVLDQLRQQIDVGGFWLMWKELVVPIARGDLQNVHLVLCLSQQDYDHYEVAKELTRLPELRIPVDEIVLEGMTGPEFATRFLEYAFYRSQTFRDKPDSVLSKAVVDSFARLPPQPISALEEMLLGLKRVFQDLELDPLH